MSDLRKLAEAATPGHWSRAQGIGGSQLDSVRGGERGRTLIAFGCGRPEDAAFIAATNPQAVIGLLDKVAAAASRWRWTVATTPGGGAILSYRAPGQSGFALIASALPRPDGMLAVRIAGQAHTPADDLPAALATIRAVLGADVPEIPNEDTK